MKIWPSIQLWVSILTWLVCEQRNKWYNLFHIYLINLFFHSFVVSNWSLEMFGHLHINEVSRNWKWFIPGNSTFFIQSSELWNCVSTASMMQRNIEIIKLITCSIFMRKPKIKRKSVNWKLSIMAPKLVVALLKSNLFSSVLFDIVSSSPASIPNNMISNWHVNYVGEEGNRWTSAPLRMVPDRGSEKYALMTSLVGRGIKLPPYESLLDHCFIIYWNEVH